MMKLLTALYNDMIPTTLAEAQAQLFVLSIWYYGLPYYVAAWMSIH